MENLLSLIDILSGLFDTFTHSWFFFGIKIFLAFYITVLLVDIILLIYLGDVRAQLRSHMYGTSKIGEKTKGQSRRDWETIFARLDKDDEGEWKLAVLEADHLIDKAMAAQGYHGDNFVERLSQIPQHAFMMLDDVRTAHTLRNRIIREGDFDVSQEQAHNAVDVFFDFLDNLGAK